MKPTPHGRSAFVRCASVIVLAAWLSGCVSSKVQRGAAIGAGAGLIAGGTTGVLISDKHLLGSDDSPQSGNIALPKGGAIAASLLIGTVFGAIVGAMVGHQRDDGYDMPEKAPAKGASTASGPTEPPKQQARAAWLREL